MRSLDFGAPEALELAHRLLLEGKVLVLPTETLYGFSALASSEEALARIESLKGIPRRRSLLALVDCFAAIQDFLHPEQERRSLEALRRCWPAPLTAVLRLREPVSWGDSTESGWTAAFRIPGHARLRALLARIGSPVISTSVNRTGMPPAQEAQEVLAAFGSEEDLTFFRDGYLDSRPSRRGSTVVDARRWPPLLLRQGDFDLQRLLEAVDSP